MSYVSIILFTKYVYSTSGLYTLLLYMLFLDIFGDFILLLTVQVKKMSITFLLKPRHYFLKVRHFVFLIFKNTNK